MYKLSLSYATNGASTCTTEFLLNTGAGIYEVNLTPLPLQWTNRTKQWMMHHHCTATQEPLRTKVTRLVQVFLSDLWARGWFDVVHTHGVDKLPGTFPIACIIRRIFKTRRKVVPKPSHPVQILERKRRDQRSHGSTSLVAAPLGKPSSHHEAITHSICATGRTLLKPGSKRLVLVTKITSDIMTPVPRIFEGTHQMTQAAHGLKDTFTFPIVLYLWSQLFRNALPKDMVVA